MRSRGWPWSTATSALGRSTSGAGWRDDGEFDYSAAVEDGSSVAVPCRRYVKSLTDAK
jgi:hypothetical protein